MPATLREFRDTDHADELALRAPCNLTWVQRAGADYGALGLAPDDLRS